MHLRLVVANANFVRYLPLNWRALFDDFSIIPYHFVPVMCTTSSWSWSEPLMDGDNYRLFTLHQVSSKELSAHKEPLHSARGAACRPSIAPRGTLPLRSPTLVVSTIARYFSDALLRDMISPQCSCAHRMRCLAVDNLLCDRSRPTARGGLFSSSSI